LFITIVEIPAGFPLSNREDPLQTTVSAPLLSLLGQTPSFSEPRAIRQVRSITRDFPPCKIPSVGAAETKTKALAWEEARSVVLREVQASLAAPATEMVGLEAAHGRVLAKDVKADRDYPALDRSLRDGFAIHAEESPGRLRVTGELRAGETESKPLPAGFALEIMTGAPVPSGADAVVMVEHVERDGDTVTIPQRATHGQFINRHGAEAQAGSTLIPAGTRLDASHVATLAMTGTVDVPVFERPSVAILSTGDELVEADARPAPHQIRNSNSYSLAALVAAAGGKPVIQPVARDTEAELTRALERGLEHDLLLISGGVSAGKYDLVKPCLKKLGASFSFERVKIQPGQPTAFAKARGKFVFGLPGNPGSSMVTFQLFARAALEVLGGMRDPILPVFRAVFEMPFKHKPGLTRFLPAFLNARGGLTHIPWQGSSDIPALARANVFLIADADRESWNAGDSIRVMLKP
jgi:molybdopterin molybdotransferase